MGLESAVPALEKIRSEEVAILHVQKKRDIIDALLVQNFLDVGEMIVKAALIREESRGMHYREDFPERDDQQWLKKIYIKREMGKMVLRADPAYHHF